MVDGVEQVSFDDVRAVLGLEHRDPVIGQQRAHALREIDHVLEVRGHEVRQHDVRRTAVAADPLRQRDAEKLRKGLEPRGGRALGDPHRRIDAEHAHPTVAKRAQQGSVVAADLDDETVARRRVPCHDPIRVGREVALEPGRKRSRIHVVAVFELDVGLVAHLKLATVAAQVEGERDAVVDARIVAHRIRDAQHRGRDRDRLERNDRLEIARAAQEAAIECVIEDRCRGRHGAVLPSVRRRWARVRRSARYGAAAGSPSAGAHGANAVPLGSNGPAMVS